MVTNTEQCLGLHCPSASFLSKLLDKHTPAASETSQASFLKVEK